MKYDEKNSNLLVVSKSEKGNHFSTLTNFTVNLRRKKQTKRFPTSKGNTHAQCWA